MSNAIFFLGRTLCFGGRTFDLATELRSPGAGTSGFQCPNFELPAVEIGPRAAELWIVATELRASGAGTSGWTKLDKVQPA